MPIQVDYKDLTEQMLKDLGDVYWGLPDQERYYDYEYYIDDAIDSILSEYDAGTEPGTLEVVAMKPQQVKDFKWPLADQILEDVLEKLDEEYADPDGEATQPTPAMIEAANNLAKVILEEYKAWTCDQVLSVSVNVKEWMKEQGHQ